MAYIAGVDIGNNTTEVAIAELKQNSVNFVSSSLVRTVGIKGTLRNVAGIIDALDRALLPLKIKRNKLATVLLNRAAPVIGDVSMETITETVITESAMIGHNPDTPGGAGLGLGFTVSVDDLPNAEKDKDLILVIPGSVDFLEAAKIINGAVSNCVRISGAIIQNDDGVLINNRLDRSIPIVDEVQHIDMVPLNMPAVIEVANIGKAIGKLSNPYDIATLFDLTPEETRNVMPIARALTGLRSAVVIKTRKGDIKEYRIAAGTITLIGNSRKIKARIEDGAVAIMDKTRLVTPLSEIQAEQGTNVGGMFETVRNVMASLTDQPVSAISVQDILAVDTLVPQKVAGGMAGEYTMGTAVGLAAMVKTHKLPMERLAKQLEKEIDIPVSVAGVEADMAIQGALTTPGTKAPLAILDLGGGSTDASFIQASKKIRSVHLAGAGDMVTLLIDKELGLEDPDLSENIKLFPLAKVETLFNLRHENGSVEFFNNPLDPKLFGRVVVISDNGPIPIKTTDSLTKIVEIRKKAKRKVFVQNAVRALKQVAPAENIRLIEFAALVGGSALDFEIPAMISDALTGYGIVIGRANVRGNQGPRNAVATGLALNYANKIKKSTG